jgi:hypothetical protein
MNFIVNSSPGCISVKACPEAEVALLPLDLLLFGQQPNGRTYLAFTEIQPGGNSFTLKMPTRIKEEELGLESVCHIPTISLRMEKVCVQNVCLLDRIHDESNFVDIITGDETRIFQHDLDTKWKGK